MQIAVVGTIIGIVLFSCFVLGFKEGLRVAMNAAKGVPPEPIRNPVIAVQDAVNDIKEYQENKKAEKLFVEGLKNILSYTGEIQNTKSNEE